MAVRVPTFKGTVGTFQTGNTGTANTPLLTVFNKTGSGVLVAIRELQFLSDRTSNQVPPKGFIAVQRLTSAPTGGTLTTPIPWDSTLSHNANIEIRQRGASDTTTAAITATPVAGYAWQQIGVRIPAATPPGQFLIDDDGNMLPAMFDVDPLILAEGEGIVVLNVTTDSTAFATALNLFYEEFNYASGGASASIAITGGGTTPESFTGAHNGGVAKTGGGTTPESFTAAHNATDILTGGGTVPGAKVKGALTTDTLTGGGTVPAPHTSAHQAVRTVAGGGVVTSAITTARSGGVAKTGGGTTLSAQTSARVSVTPLTGGGVITEAYTRSGAGAESHSGTVLITGGGTAPSLSTSGHAAVDAVTGGGIVTLTYSTTGTIAIAPVPGIDQMASGRGRRTEFDDWTLMMDDELVVELYLLRKTR